MQLDNLDSNLGQNQDDQVGEVTRMRIETELGAIDAEVYPDRAPITVSNFLRYVDQGYYDGGQFHRTVHPDNQPDDAVRIEVIQASVRPDRVTKLRAPIPLERTTVTGLRHQDGTISMARRTPDSATADFFICIGDQPSLDYSGSRNPDKQGFAAFGCIVSGMQVVKAIQQSSAEAQRLVPPVKIVAIRRT